ncbi:hypothetical protein TVAG_259020 [Trichomonas vaginalis G3]|uniref:receptor protein-tyrosine kinase n=1 Tax=Trichomonas vaginalis (strain ATCC PRA-98 / G3) TaxID=412133 RepID=A2EBV3_TRIV3|nr:glycine-rich protein family [Trichomonas vaginalis G3]XP_001322044.1 glycine-rich protein family [Trichomonas vaginalis G3]EAX89107.1 hypothetical protein TVAG_442640 [Trichomonas vaginalis G3]EAY09821.1 hypothetical protein TVAG_259020 [Trichomonas vaginalis G3]KAI5505954.1 glycine-rich protein family [Trichomonas vaginalis G3]KAI5505981.1 glycine-rich protein family [Trichomonas vaginalis G3]|eukprot:XP_001302037.1 hypothetical protein [Trichomonas vaginalis G3]
MQPGGYGGGGSSANFPSGSGSGGGQTAVKFHENDLWHRVLVSGAGGGCDDSQSDDGSGGAGGNLTAQGWFANSVMSNSYLANSTFGFSFGQGEAARFGQPPPNNSLSVKSSSNTDIAGAGGGWFGGFSAQNGYSGASGGSSFALTKDAIIPQGNITASDEFYNLIDSKPYAFDLHSEYLFTEVEHMPGIWTGNGRLIITILDTKFFVSCKIMSQIHFNFAVILEYIIT